MTITPIEAAKIETCIELDAVGRRLGSATVPRAIVVRIEFDDRTGAVKAVECQEERYRRVHDGTLPSGERRA